MVGAQDTFQRAQGRSTRFDFPPLLGGTLGPGGRRLHLPGRLGAQRGIQKTSLAIVEPVAGGMLAGGAIQQHLLQFFHGPGVDEGELAIFQPGVALTGKKQPLNIRRRELFAARGLVGHIEIKPLLAGRRDLEPGLDTFEVLAGAAIQALFQGHFPFALQAGKFPGKKVQHRILAADMKQPRCIRTEKARALQTLERGLFGGKIAGAIAQRGSGIRQPERIRSRGEPGRYAVVAVQALQLAVEHGQPAGEMQAKTRAGCFEHKVSRGKIGGEIALLRQAGPVRIHELRHPQARQAHLAGQ